MKGSAERKLEQGILTIIPQQDNDLVDRIKQKILEEHVAFCDKCGYKYNPKDVQVQQITSLHATAVIKCSKCGSTHIVIANLAGFQRTAEKIQLMVDVPTEELVSRLKQGKISYKEVISLMKSLKQPQLTVKRLLSSTQ